MSAIQTAADLEACLGVAGLPVKMKVIDHIDDGAAAWIAASPLAFVAFADGHGPMATLAGGALLGAVIYVGLARIPARQVFSVTNLLIALLAGSLASQLARALAQAGFIDTWTSPLWDSSRLLSQDSAVGTLLHALAGYDAHPSAAQLASYVAALLFIYVGTKLLSAPAPAR